MWQHMFVFIWRVLRCGVIYCVLKDRKKKLVTEKISVFRTANRIARYIYM